MSKKQNWLVIIAGPNGAGKSTFYEKFLQKDPLFSKAPFVNLDNYAKEMAEDEGGNPEEYLLQAGRTVRNNINENFKKNRNFIYETTASGLTHLRIMEEAKKHGYKVATIFIGLSKVELSHLRVAKRVDEGGHSVPTEDIERRYPRVIKNFPDMLARSDLAAVFDNSSKEAYKLIFLMDEYNFRIFYKYPRWVKEAIQDRKTSKNFILVSTSELKKSKKEKIKKIIEDVFKNVR